MKTSKILFAVAASALLLSVQSCLKDQDDVFSESSSARLQALMDAAVAQLSAPENGWIMEYYPGGNQAHGGYAYHLKFTEAEVTAICELDPEHSYTSYYKITNDNGAVLSFDVYNPALHYFATPSSSEYEAKGGDFEFTITSVSAEKIGLRGKRSGNHCDLYPYKSTLAPGEYMAGAAYTASVMSAAQIEGNVGGVPVFGELDFNRRNIVFSYPAGAEDAKTVRAPYMYTPEGLRLYEDVKIAGATFRDFYYFADNNILTNGSVEFQGKLPVDYVSYKDFQGEYTLYTSGGNYEITISADDTNTGFILSGMGREFDCHLEYDPAKGRANWYGQTVGENGNNQIWLVAVAGSSLYVTQSTGMVVHYDVEKEYFIFSDNGEGPDGFNADGWVLWEVDASGNSVGQWQGWSKSFFGAFQKLVRK